jgi:hypothetical protein
MDSSGRCRVLIVDDSRDERDVCGVLSGVGVSDPAADSAVDGCRLALELGRVAGGATKSGPDLTRWMKDSAATCKVPVVIVSGPVFPANQHGRSCGLQSLRAEAVRAGGGGLRGHAAGWCERPRAPLCDIATVPPRVVGGGELRARSNSLATNIPAPCHRIIEAAR